MLPIIAMGMGVFIGFFISSAMYRSEDDARLKIITAALDRLKAQDLSEVARVEQARNLVDNNYSKELPFDPAPPAHSDPSMRTIDREIKKKFGEDYEVI